MPNITIALDPLTIVLVMLTSVRLLAAILFLDLWLQKRTPKHFLLLSGWLTLTLSTGWGLYTHLFWPAMEHTFFSLVSGLGTFWIGCGILVYLREFEEIIRLKGKRLVIIGTVLILAFSLLPLLGVNLGPIPGVFVQLFITLVVIYASTYKRRAFMQLGATSYTWLIILTVLTTTLTLAYGSGLVGDNNLAIGFTGTTLVQFVAVIFFLHLEFNLANRELQASQRQFQHLAENAQDIIYHYDLSPKRGFSYVSPAVLSITGYTPEEFKTDPNLGFKLIHPEDRNLLRAYADKEEDVKTLFTIRWRKKDGGIIWCEQRNVPIYDDLGNLVAFEGIARDITAERQAARQYQQLFEGMREGLALHEIILDDEGHPVDYRFLKINPAFTELTGLEAEDIIGRTVLEVLPDTEPYWIETYGKVTLTGKPAHIVNYSQALGKYYEVTAYQTEPNQFASIFLDVTERIRSEEQLRASEERYRALFDQSLHEIYLNDLDGQILEVNQQACRQLGYSAEELVGASVFSLHPPPSDDELSSDDILRQWRHWQPGEMHNLIIKHRRKDGSTYPLEISTGVVLINTEPCILGVGIDITERLAAAQQLAESEAQLRALFANMTGVVLVMDAEGRHLSIAPTQETLLYRPAEAQLGKTVHEVLPAPQADYILSVIQQALATGVDTPAEYTLDIQGNPVWFTATASPLSDETVLWVAHDITERRAAEQQLAESEAQLRALFANMSDLVLVLDAEGRYLDIAPTQPNLLYQSAETMLGKTIHEVLPAPQADYILSIIQQALATGGDVQAEYTLEIEGEPIWFSGTASPISDESIIWVAHDITERKQMEDALLHGRQLLDYTIEHSNNAVAVHDTDLNYIYASQQYIEFNNIADPDVIGKHLYQVLPNLSQKWRDVVQKALSGEVTGADEEQHINKDGELEWIRWETRPWHEADGTIGGIIHYIEDITQPRREKEELRRLRDDLQAQVAEQTVELQARIAELERFHQATLDREFRIKELREQIKQLQADR